MIKRFTGNGSHFLISINYFYLSDSTIDSVNVRDAIVCGNEGHGMSILSVYGDISIRDSSFRDNVQHGIYIYNNYGYMKMTNSTVEDNDQSGVYSNHDEGELLIEKSDISRNKDNGIYVRVATPSDVVLTMVVNSSSVSYNGIKGIMVDHVSGCNWTFSLTDSDIIGNGDRGVTLAQHIYCVSGGVWDISESTFSDNKNGGLEMHYAGAIEIKNNQFLTNTGDFP